MTVRVPTYIQARAAFTHDHFDRYSVHVRTGKFYRDGTAYAKLLRSRGMLRRTLTERAQVTSFITWTNERLLQPRFEPVDTYRWVSGDEDCNANLLAALDRVGKDLGKIIWIRSGRRTLAEQQFLWDLYGPPRAAQPSPNAPHVRGIAADCGIDGLDIGSYPGARAAMRRHGLCLRVPGEPWHVELGAAWAS